MTTAARPSGWNRWKSRDPGAYHHAERERVRMLRHAIANVTGVYRCPYCGSMIAATKSNPPRTFCPHLDADGRRCRGSGCVVA